MLCAGSGGVRLSNVTTRGKGAGFGAICARANLRELMRDFHVVCLNKPNVPAHFKCMLVRSAVQKDRTPRANGKTIPGERLL